jgi:hypothetical protein
VAGTLTATGTQTLSGTTTISTITSAAATALTLKSAGTTAVTVDTSQNVGIGTTSPASKLDINTGASTGTTDMITLGGLDNASTKQTYGVIQMGIENNTASSEQGNILLQTVESGTVRTRININGSGYQAFSNGGTERMRIASNGIVTMNAYGAGAATFSAAGVISSVSDETWKIKDGVPVDTDSMLKKLEPGYWYYNDEKKETFGTDRQLGFYAQNVNSAIGPEAAPTPEEGKPWGYYDRSVLAVAVISLQKALATIESLTARVVALEAK